MLYIGMTVKAQCMSFRIAKEIGELNIQTGIFKQAQLNYIMCLHDMTLRVVHKPNFNFKQKHLVSNYTVNGKSSFQFFFENNIYFKLNAVKCAFTYSIFFFFKLNIIYWIILLIYLPLYWSILWTLLKLELFVYLDLQI